MGLLPGMTPVPPLYPAICNNFNFLADRIPFLKVIGDVIVDVAPLSLLKWTHNTHGTTTSNRQTNDELVSMCACDVCYQTAYGHVRDVVSVADTSTLCWESMFRPIKYKISVCSKSVFKFCFTLKFCVNVLASIDGVVAARCHLQKKPHVIQACWRIHIYMHDNWRFRQAPRTQSTKCYHKNFVLITCRKCKCKMLQFMLFALFYRNFVFSTIKP